MQRETFWKASHLRFPSWFPPRFIIELCEPVQVKQLDIANFELFSSTPRDFIVSISDR